MGEYANYRGVEMKIGTCSSMYYVRYEDREKLVPINGSLNPAECKNLFWRLPFPDEDTDDIFGVLHYYNGFNRSVPLEGWGIDTDLWEAPGTIYLKHNEGGLTIGSKMRIKMKCYHGIKTPEENKDFEIFDNFKPSFILESVKNDSVRGLCPVVKCQYCNDMWSLDSWEDILKYVTDEELRERLQKYADEKVNN